MGISLDQNLGVSTALNLFTVFTLPTGEQFNRNMAFVNTNFHTLVPKLFSADYDNQVPPQIPVQILSLLIVDHIEQMDELKQILTFHGTLALNWQDKRLIWDPRDYGNLNRLSFTALDINRFWLPGVVIKGVSVSTKPLMQYQNTVITLSSDGTVVAEVGVSLRASCRMDLRSYPNDNQTCHVMIFTPLYSTSTVTFSLASSVITRQTFFSDNNMTMTSGFVLESLNAQRFYAYSKGFTTNETEANMLDFMTNTILRYQILLRRNIGLSYFVHISLPMFCTAILTFFAVSAITNTRLCLGWLLTCLILQLGNNFEMSKFTPQDYDSDPICVDVSLFLLWQTLAFVLVRFLLALYRAQCEGDEKGWQSKLDEKLHIAESLLPYCLTTEAVVLFYILFM